MTETEADRDAIQRGRDLADGLLKRPAAPVPRAAVAPARDLLFAIGDSWFNYWPRGDILDVLEDQLHHTIERKAKAGRKLTEMLYQQPPSLLGTALPPSKTDGAEISWLTKRLVAMTADEKQRLQAILVSAGGNDVAGDRDVLMDMVNQKDPNGGNEWLNESNVAKIVDARLRAHYLTLVACIARACETAEIGSRVPILLHGYDFPVADGRGVLGVSWLKKPLEDRGYKDLAERVDIMKRLIDRLNEMQMAVVSVVGGHADLQHVELRHIELRGTLTNGAGYTVYWQNELHPTIPVGFGEVSKKFIAELGKLTLAAQGAARARGAIA